MSVEPVPSNYPQISPYLIVDDAAAAIAYYAAVFGAVERLRIDVPDGRIGHAELGIGTGLIMLADAFPESGIEAPGAYRGSPVTIQLYVPDVDVTIARAVQAGGTQLGAVENQLFGDRTVRLRDPFGHHWHLATHIEDVSPDEIKRRMARS